MSRECKTLTPELAELFATSEALYDVTLEAIAAGKKLPADAMLPSRIAFEVMMAALKERVPCPEWAANCVIQDWQSFEDFKCESIVEAFGVPDTTHAQSKRAARLCCAVYFSVRALQSQSMPLADNAKGKGALSIVGDKYHMSPGQVKQRMAQWRDLCKTTGSDPDEPQKYADPQPLIAQAIARALDPQAKKARKL